MKENMIISFLLLNISFCYYSLKLRQIFLPTFTSDSNNIEIINIKNETKLNFQSNDIKNEEIESEIYLDLPLNDSELNMLKESYIKTKNIKSEFYTTDFYIGYNKQYFRLLLSTSDDYITIAGKNCIFCNVSNKYDYNLSKSSNQLKKKEINYTYFQDSFLIPSINKKLFHNLTKMNFKVIESNESEFLNSDIYDGTLALNYNDNNTDNNLEIPNSSFIQELYKEGKISSPSFSVIITSSNINRLYLGNIMENYHIKNYIDSKMNKGECNIINNNWTCKIEKIEYKNYIYTSKSHHIYSSSSSTVKFDIKQNKLIIPEIYYNLIVVGWRWGKKRCRKNCNYSTKKYVKKYDKWCIKYGDTIYCTCNDINNFGLVTFYFENKSTLNIDLRNYIYYDKSAFNFHCKVDIELSKNNEFIVGLRGLNNTILSFDMTQKKIEFFHKKQTIYHFKFYLIIGFFIILIILVYCYKN